MDNTNINTKLRIYFNKLLIDQKNYKLTLEDYFQKYNSIATNIHIEFILPNEVWPSSLTGEKPLMRFRSFAVGLNNLGNSKVL